MSYNIFFYDSLNQLSDFDWLQLTFDLFNFFQQSYSEDEKPVEWQHLAVGEREIHHKEIPDTGTENSFICYFLKTCTDICFLMWMMMCLTFTCTLTFDTMVALSLQAFYIISMKCL